IAHCGVVHPQVRANAAHDDQPGVQSLSDLQTVAALAAQLFVQRLQGLLNCERRLNGAACMILMRDGCAEQSHDAIAQELVDCALVAVDFLDHDLNRAPHAGMRVLRIQVLRLGRGPDDIHEQDCDLLALSFQRAPVVEYFFGQMLRGVILRSMGIRHRLGEARWLPTVRTELCSRGNFAAATGTNPRHCRAALLAKLRANAVLTLAARTLHGGWGVPWETVSGTA